jgi:hypothetical protein
MLKGPYRVISETIVADERPPSPGRGRQGQSSWRISENAVTVKFAELLTHELRRTPYMRSSFAKPIAPVHTPQDRPTQPSTISRGKS